MDSLTLVLIIAVVVNLFITTILLLRSKNNKSDDSLKHLLTEFKSEFTNKQLEGLLTLKDSVEQANSNLSSRLSEGNAAIDKRLAVVNEIENKLGKLSTQTSNLESIGKNIQSLSDILKPPKMRGQFGEILLENLLREILPEALLEFQYSFKNNVRVDAIVKLNERLLPIDSKFPLESFNRLISIHDEQEKIKADKEFAQAIKKHIDSISSKYICPDENSTEFALMYIPAEAIYSHLLSHEQEQLFQYSLSKKVIPSSPGHLYGFLASISAIYREAGITTGSRKFSELLNSLHENVSKLNDLQDRAAGSLRSAVKNVDKIKERLHEMESQIQNFLDMK